MQNPIITSLLNNQSVVFPTDTVPGIAMILSSDNIGKIHELKKRSLDKKISIILRNTDQISKFALVTEYSKHLIEKYLPGPLTIVLPVNSVFSLKNYFESFIGIRIIKNDYVNDVIDETGPLLLTSCNQSGKQPLLEIKQIKNVFQDQVKTPGFLIKYMRNHSFVPSTVIKIENENCTVLRIGETKVSECVIQK